MNYRNGHYSNAYCKNVKRKKENISMPVLQEKAKGLLLEHLKDDTPEFAGFSMDDI
ncbi:MAG: hypothetical protein JNK09_01220 [Prolixibacteraceae bacterium]|nr:hypothetical protein [Prolixibacteraceae bacterium]